MDELRFQNTQQTRPPGRNQREREKPPEDTYDDGFFEDEDVVEEEDISADDQLLNLFKGKKLPDYKTAWQMYEKGLQFNTQIRLDETIQVNENFFVGKAA